MNIETMRAVPPPIPEDAKRKGPPPIPEDAARRRKTEPEYPAAVNRPSFRTIESKERTTRLRIGMASEAAFDHPDRNEDSFYASPKDGVFLAADGMGGVPAGDEASRITAEQPTTLSLREGITEAASPDELGKAELIKNVFSAGREEIQNRNAVQEAIKEMILRMNRKVEEFAKKDPTVREKALDEYEKNFGPYDEKDERAPRVLQSILESIGSTVSLAKMWRGPDGKDRITLGQVGDSRVYRLRNGKLKQLTTDDSHVQILIEEGIKDKDGVPILDDQDVDRLVPKESVFKLAETRRELRPLLAKYLRSSEPYIRLGDIRAMVTQGVGLGSFMQKQLETELKPSVTTDTMEDGDLYLLATDGITDVLLESEIEEILTRYAADPQAAAVELERLASIRTLQGKSGRQEALGDDERSKRKRAKTDDRTGLVIRYERTA